MLQMNGYRVARRVLIDRIWYICNLSYSDTIEHWECANAKLVADYLTKQGLKVVSIDDSRKPQRIDVDTTIYHFLGEVFHLNQCEDIFEWFRTSNKGEFTHYYKHLVFHVAGDKFLSAYADDINNYIQI